MWQKQSTYPVVDYWLEGVLQLLEDPVALQDVDDAEEQEESLALVVSSRNATRPEMNNVNPLQKRTGFCTVPAVGQHLMICHLSQTQVTKTMTSIMIGQ